MKTKKIIHTLILLSAASTASYYLLTGKHGISAEHSYKKAILEKLKIIEKIESDNALLEKELAEWNQSSFFKEKMAREELHLSCTNEWVYFIK